MQMRGMHFCYKKGRLNIVFNENEEIVTASILNLSMRAAKGEGNICGRLVDTPSMATTFSRINLLCLRLLFRVLIYISLPCSLNSGRKILPLIFPFKIDLLGRQRVRRVMAFLVHLEATIEIDVAI